MTRIDPYDVIAVEPDRFIQSQATRHVRPDWLARQLGISTDELARRLNVSAAELDARLDRSARAKRKPTSARLLWEPEPFDEMRSRPLGGDLSGGQNDHPKTAEALAALYGVSDKTIRRDVAGGLAVGHTEVMAVGMAAMMETDHGSEAVQGG